MKKNGWFTKICKASFGNGSGYELRFMGKAKCVEPAVFGRMYLIPLFMTAGEPIIEEDKHFRVTVPKPAPGVEPSPKCKALWKFLSENCQVEYDSYQLVGVRMDMASRVKQAQAKNKQELSPFQLLSSEGMCRANTLTADERKTRDFNARLEGPNWDNKVGLPYAELKCIKDVQFGQAIVWKYKYNQDELNLISREKHPDPPSKSNAKSSKKLKKVWNFQK